MERDRSFLWSGQLKGEAVEETAAKFKKWFINDVTIISLDHRDNFGKDVEIIAKVDTVGKNHFYSFDKKTNQYRMFVPKRRWRDEHGYTHFVTDVGGDIILSRGPLVRRSRMPPAAKGDF